MKTAHFFSTLVAATVVFSLFSMFPSYPAQVNAQDWRALSMDVDSDGLPNSVEDDGWYNGSGGPYVTDYGDSDSDDDGLTDGQEKLFDTDPLDSYSPGIFVLYRDDFTTSQYFPWQRFGTHYIALPTPSLDSIVVRRGSTFSVGGPPKATLEITKSIGGLTTLTPVRDACGGGWSVYVPEDGTVGIYELSMSDGSGWTQNLNLYIIFELPSGRSEEFLDAFIYDGDPSNTRDTSSIAYWEGGDSSSTGWRQTEYTHEDYAWIPEDEWITHGYTWAFDTQHFDDFVFEAEVMPTINGEYQPWYAANALGARVDELTCVDWPNPLPNSWCVMNPGSCFPYELHNQCTNVSNLLTSFNRSAGIPSRPMWTDWTHSTFDHSTEAWVRRPSTGVTDWFLMRGYAHREGPCSESQVTGGYIPLRDPSGWYSSGQGVYSASENWTQVYGGTTYHDKFRMASWDLDKTAKTGKIVKRSWYESRYVDYWDWPAEPTVTGAPPDDWPSLPPAPTADFSGFPTSGENPLIVEFTDASTGHIRTWSWDFGDGGTSTQQSPAYTYTVAGDFDVTLTVTGAGGSDTLTRWNYILVTEPPPPAPTANFSGSPTAGTAPLSVDFTDESSGTVTEWSWDFGDGGSSTAQNPTYVYNSDGTFDVTLTVIGPGGSDSRLRNNYIHVNPSTLGAPSDPEEGDRDSSRYSATNLYENNSNPVFQFGEVLADYAVDLDGDGRYNQLVFEIEVDVAQAGEYWIRGKLAQGMIESVGKNYLEQGRQRIALIFDGPDIYMNKIDGPFVLDGLWATDIESPSRADFGEYQLAHLRPEYESAAYEYQDFGLTGARLSEEYKHFSDDTDGDGYADALAVETDLDIERPDVYTVRGLLFDGQGKLIGQAAWTGSRSPVTLRFEDIKGTTGPYTLEQLHVRNAAGEVTDGMKEPYIIGQVPELNAKAITLGVERSINPYAFAPTLVITTTGYSDAGVDLNGNGRYDQLVFTADVEVAPEEAGGSYRLEGWLVDQNNTLVSWAMGDAQVLTEGVHSLSLAFEGRIINAHGVDGPLTLAALKVLPHDSYDVLDAVDVAHTTSDYNVSQFDSLSTAPAVNLFSDAMEDGSGKWVDEWPWSLVNSVWHSFSHAWEAAVSGSGSGALTTNSLDVSEYANPALKFNTCYDMQTIDDVGYLEATTNGTDWTRVMTYTDATPHWTTQLLDLTGFGETTNLQLRFNADSQENLLWHIDDVYLFGWPAVTDVSFLHSPQPVLTNQEITFVASYDAIDTSFPITYTWDFDDGSAPMVTDVPTITRQFNAWDDYAVELAVENPFDTTVYSQTITAYQPVVAASFNATSDDLTNDWVASFTGVITPLSATQPVTYTWDFGDGSARVVTTTQTVTHEYTVKDTYTVGLTATNGYSGAVTYNGLVVVPLDDDGDGLPNSVDGPDDTDGDGYPDYQDTDSDGDGIPDAVEAGDNPLQPVDSDGDGTPDYQDLDSDDDSIPDVVEAGPEPTDPPDSDNDGKPDYIDTDSDDDAIPDAGEWSTGPDDPLAGCTADDPICTNNDADNDGKPNYIDTDSDNDGFTDLEEGTDDSDGDGIPDYLDAERMYMPVFLG